MREEITVTPTVSANGFVAGQSYTFKHDINRLYVCTLPNGWIRYESEERLLQGGRSSHLWDGFHWAKAGEFKLIN